MNLSKLNHLESAIKHGRIGRSKTYFAGANLIISNDPMRSHHVDDELVVTGYAEEMSWVIFQLKDIFADEIDFLSKLAFYPELGKAANRAIGSSTAPNEVLQAIIDRAKDFWSNRSLRE